MSKKYPQINLLMHIVQTVSDPELTKRMQDALHLEESRYYYSVIDSSVLEHLGFPDNETIFFIRDKESDLEISVSSLNEADEIMESLEENNG